MQLWAAQRPVSPLYRVASDRTHRAGIRTPIERMRANRDREATQIGCLVTMTPSTSAYK